MDYMLSIILINNSSKLTMKRNRYVNIVVGLRKQQNTQIQDPSLTLTKSCNVFRCQVPQRCKISLAQSNRSFDFVGVKQLRSYYDRVRRQSKENKRSTISNYLGIPRVSVEAKPKEQSTLMNKDQLFSIKSADHSFRNNLAEHLNTTSHTDKLHDTSNLFFQSKETSFNSTHTFSLQKVKRNFKNYEELWQKEEVQWQQKKGFPSILRNISEQRLKIEQKESISLHNLKDHLTYQMWEDSLRRGKDIKGLFNRKTAGTKISKKMMLKGKNKQESEKSWVTSKGNAGYQFKLLKEEDFLKTQQ